MKKIVSLFIIGFCALMINAQTLDRSIRPTAQPMKEIVLKDAQQFTLANGLKVFLVEDQTSPITLYSIVLDVKPALEKEKAGLSGMFGEVFGKATKKRSKEQLNKELDLIAGKLNLHQKGGSIVFLKKYEKQALTLFSDALLNPVFPQSEFDLVLEQYKSALKAMSDDGGLINRRVSSALTFGANYPDGEIETEASLANVSLADLPQYYKTYFAPNVARLVIVGDISLAEAKVNANKYFGKWTRKNVPVAKYVIPEAPLQTTVAFINKPGAVQTSIDISYAVPYHVGISDYIAAQIANYILGGGGNARLFMNLRETHSYTYGVYSDLSAAELTGRFLLTAGRTAASVKASVTDSALYEIFNEIHRIIDEPVSETELANAKTFLAGAFSRGLERSETIANFALNIDKYKLPKDYYKNYLKRLEAVTVADVQAAAKKYLRPENAWLVVTGDKSCAEKLLPFAADKTVHYYDFDANQVEAPIAQQSDISAETILANYIQAIGGEASIAGINDYLLTGEMQMMGQTVSIKQAFKKPNLSMTEISMGGMIIQKMAFDGATLRISGMQGSKELTEGKEYEAAKQEAALIPEQLYAANGYTFETGDIEQVNGSDAYVVYVLKDDNKTTNYFDKATGLKVKSLITVETPMGEQQAITEYSDYRPVNGVMFPFNIKQTASGMTMETVVKTIEVNKGLDDSVFK